MYESFFGIGNRMNIDEEMSAMGIKIMKGGVLKSNNKEDWIVEIVNIPNYFG